MNYDEHNEEEERSLIDLLLGFINKVCVLVFVILLVIVAYQKIGNHNVKVGDYRVITVMSKTMEPSYKKGDIVIIKSVDQSELIKGDDIAYLSGGLKKNAKLMFERINDVVVYEDGNVEFITSGIKTPSNETTVKEDQIYGKLIYKTYLISTLGRFASKPITYVILVVIPVVLFVIFKLRNLLSNFKQNKKEKKLTALLEDDLDNEDDDDDDEESNQIIKKYYE